MKTYIKNIKYCNMCPECHTSPKEKFCLLTSLDLHDLYTIPPECPLVDTKRFMDVVQGVI